MRIFLKSRINLNFIKYCFNIYDNDFMISIGLLNYFFNFIISKALLFLSFIHSLFILSLFTVLSHFLFNLGIPMVAAVNLVVITSFPWVKANVHIKRAKCQMIIAGNTATKKWNFFVCCYLCICLCFLFQRNGPLLLILCSCVIVEFSSDGKGE